MRMKLPTIGMASTRTRRLESMSLGLTMAEGQSPQSFSRTGPFWWSQVTPSWLINSRSPIAKTTALYFPNMLHSTPLLDDVLRLCYVDTCASWCQTGGLKNRRRKVGFGDVHQGNKG